jgi:hypothetical protein
MEVTFKIKLTKSQQEIYNIAHDPKYKFITLVLSRQQGKTTSMMILVMEWLLEKDKKIGYVCRNNVFVRTMYDELVKVIPDNLIKRKNGSSFIIESIFGSKLQIFSAESGASLRGQSFHYLICDEFPFFKMEQTDGTHLWKDILSPTLKARGKKCIFVSTPLGKNNIFYEMYQRGLSDEFPNYASILKTIYDDGFINQDEIDEIRKSIPEMSFRQEYLCEWLDDGLSFFQGYSDCFDIEQYSGNKSWIGCDLSGDGSDATICAKVSDNGSVEIFEAKGTLDMKYRQIADYIDKNNPVAVYAENNGIGLPIIGEIKKLPRNRNRIYEWTTTNSTKEEIVSDMAVMIANKELHFRKSDTTLYNELGNFVVTVSKTRKLTFAARGSSHDDQVMATAIALKCRTDFKYSGNNNMNFVRTNTKLLY